MKGRNAPVLVNVTRVRGGWRQHLFDIEIKKKRFYTFNLEKAFNHEVHEEHEEKQQGTA
jgi:hypothetical protein